jgi:hypothetical protein
MQYENPDPAAEASIKGHESVLEAQGHQGRRRRLRPLRLVTGSRQMERHERGIHSA